VVQKLRQRYIILAICFICISVTFTAYCILASNTYWLTDKFIQITIDKVDWNNQTGQIKIYIHSYNSNTSVTQVYVNGQLDNQTNVPLDIAENQTVEMTLSQKYDILPTKLNIKVCTADNKSYGRTETFIGFEMLRTYWNESTKKIDVLLSHKGSYPWIKFGDLYVNGTLDPGAVPILYSNFTNIYKISLSDTYSSKPVNMSLKFTTNGIHFNLASPFTEADSQGELRWDKNTGHLIFSVYIPSAYHLEGKKDLTFDGLYFNGTRDESPTITRTYRETYEIVSSKTYAACPSQITAKVTADFGEYWEDSLP
jgi:hypothetical protein